MVQSCNPWSKLQTGANVVETREKILAVVCNRRIYSEQRKYTVLIYLMSNISCSNMECVTPNKGQIQVCCKPSIFYEFEPWSTTSVITMVREDSVMSSRLCGWVECIVDFGSFVVNTFAVQRVTV